MILSRGTYVTEQTVRHIARTRANGTERSYFVDSRLLGGLTELSAFIGAIRGQTHVIFAS